MKKLLVLSLAILMVISFFASCDEGVEHLGHTYEYIIDETGHFKQFTCGCSPSHDISEEHHDYDSNDVCDVCGSILPTVLEEHYDNDGDLHCDICGYLMEITTEPPIKTLLRDQVGAEWLYEIDAEDIAELKMIREPEGVGPGSYRWVASSTLTAPISRILEEYFNMGVTLVPRDEAIVPGGSNMIVEFILKDGTKKEFVFYDGCYHDIVNDRYYRLDYYPTFNDVPEYTSYCQFITIGEWDKCEIWYDDPTEPYFVCDIPLEELKFNVFNGNVGAGVSEYPYFIETDFGRLGFISNDVFFIVGNGTYYELVGKNLDELIADATATEYSVTMNDEEWLYEDLQSMYKAGETVSVKIGIAYDLGYMLFVNGKRVMDEAYTEGPYWEFIFTMPECDVVIDFKTYDGFLPHHNYGVLIETFWEKIPEADSVSVVRYYGEYDSGAIVAMMACSEYDHDEAEWDVDIDGVVIHYNNGNRIIVLYEGEFYSLLDAKKNGYLTAEDIQAIADLHHNKQVINK